MLNFFERIILVVADKGLQQCVVGDRGVDLQEGSYFGSQFAYAVGALFVVCSEGSSDKVDLFEREVVSLRKDGSIAGTEVSKFVERYVYSVVILFFYY